MSQDLPALTGENDVARALAAVETAAQAANDALAAAETSSALVPTGGDAMLVKAQAREAYVRAHRASADLIAAQQAAQAAVKAQAERLEAELAAKMGPLKELQKQVRQTKEVIWTVNLYLGRDETIIPLATGTPSPADTPIVVRQQVLAMDEETGAHAATGGSDVTNIDEFDQWITSDPAHLAQVLPEQRGVVAIMARRKERDYGDPWLNARKNEANQETWFLIRNGENLYRMITDFHVGARLVPRRDEFTGLFVDRHTKQPLTPGSRAWLDAEAAAGARERHFMRIALILQGLLDRTEVFRPLPEPALTLLAPDDYDTGRIRLLTDDENALGTGRTPFYKWLAAKNSLLTPGMRIIIETTHQDWPRERSGRYSGENPRIHPPRASYPSRDEVHTLVKRGTKPHSFVFTYDRTDYVHVRDSWGYYESRQAKSKASCTVYTGDQFIIPIDLVTIAEMRDYLDARTERGAYADMFPTLRAAIAVKEAEAELETPFRTMLAGLIAQAEDIDLDTATGYVEDMVQWWKIGNRWHRALVGDQAAEAKATKAILAERARLARAVGNGDRDKTVVADIRRAHPDVLLIARRKNGTYVALVPESRQWALPVDGPTNHYKDQVAPLNIWVSQHEYTTTGKHKSTREWTIPAPGQVSRWISLYEGEQWPTWNKAARARDHLTDPEIQTFIDTVRADAGPDGHALVAITYREERGDGGEAATVVAYYHPTAPITLPERYLTDGHKRIKMDTRVWRWSRDTTGTVTYRNTDRPDGHHNTWDVGHNSLIDGKTLGKVSPPWVGDRRSKHIVYVDAQAMTLAQAQAKEWNQHRVRVAHAQSEAHRLVTGIEQAWVDRALAQAKARFIEDFGDESLWPEHAKNLNIRAPWRNQSHLIPVEYKGVPAGLAHLVNRLTESDLPPFGLTVADALVTLDETLREPAGHAYRGSWGGQEVTLADDVLDLRFPGTRLQIDAPQ
jgi:hypothetical protein